MTDHPSQLLPIYTKIGAQFFGSAFNYEFSRYVYVPQQISELRNPFRLLSETVQAEYETCARKLSENEEIAFHSSIYSGTKRAHFPLLDMSCADIQPHLPELKRAFLDFEIPKLNIYFSGRSFHIYGHGVLKDDDALVRFMGRILLLNLPGKERVIDERWVGHRLMGRCLTLRWTCNSSFYRGMPKLVYEVSTSDGTK